MAPAAGAIPAASNRGFRHFRPASATFRPRHPNPASRRARPCPTIRPMTLDLVDFDRRLKAPTRRLARALGLRGQLGVVHEFGEGKTNTRVLRIVHRARPDDPAPQHYIFKYGPAPLLTREIARYVDFSRHVQATSLFTELLAPDATRARLADAPESIGALAYRDAGTQAGVGGARALGDRLGEALADPAVEPWPADCPAQITAALAGLLRQETQHFGSALARHYEDRWLPDMEIVFGAAHARPAANSTLLAHPDFAPDRFGAARSDPDALGDWCRGLGAPHPLRRSGLEVIGRWGGAVWVRDDDAEPPLRLKLAPEENTRARVAHLKPGDLVDLWVRADDVASTRHGLYVERARAAAPCWPEAQKPLKLGRWVTPNPLYITADALKAPDGVRCGPAHGDLHPGNVLLAGGVPLFIDYGLAEASAPAGVDIARLLGCFIRELGLWLAPPALIEAIAALLDLPGSDVIESPDARRAVALLRPWRDAWLEARPGAPLARHLLGFAFIGLKWTEDDGRDPLRHRACLVLAALAAADGIPDGMPDAIDPFTDGMNDGINAASDAIAVYRTHLKRAHARVVPFFQRPGRPALLEELFVQLELTRAGLHAEETRRPRGKSRCTLEELLAGVAGGGPRWLLLGDPGAGKSTLARRLAADLAGRDDGPIAVYVPLAAWAEVADAGDPFDFAEARARDCPSRAGRSVDGLADALRAAAAEPGRVWLLLDGFDEVAPARVEATHGHILALADTWPAVTLAVLSRFIGARSLDGFDRAHVARLDGERQRALLTRWLGAERGARVWAEVDSRPALHDAAGNPLLLSLLAKIVSVRADTPGADDAGLPTTRAEVFGAAIALLLDRGHCLTPRGLGAHRTDARLLLRALSLDLTEAGGEQWPADAIDRRLSQLCAADDDLEARLGRGWTTSGQCVETIALQTGILGPHDGADGHWRYLHRSLRERLAAEALKDMGPTAIVARVEAIADEPELLGRWGETLGMACALLDDPSAPLAALRAADAALTVRVLPELTGLPLDVALGALWPIDVGGGHLTDHTWDGETLYALIGERPVADAARHLLARVTPEIDLDRLSFVYHALDRIGQAPDRAAFFAAAGRPIDAAPTFAMCEIPGGVHWIGSPDDEAERGDPEGPRFAVELAAFAMGRDPVTVAEYRRFDPEHTCPGGPLHPVTEVSWWRARLFAAWAGLRLPTEAEWEAACRGRTTTRFWSGDTDDALARVGWFDRNSGRRAHPVDAMPDPDAPAHPYGLRGMHGNVDEWCRDWLGPYPAPPADGAPLAAPAGPDAGADRVIRGGSWYSVARWCRSAYRSRWLPGIRVVDLGFRLVRAPRAPWP